MPCLEQQRSRDLMETYKIRTRMKEDLHPETFFTYSKTGNFHGIA